MKYTSLEIKNKKIVNIIKELNKLAVKHNKEYFKNACSRYVIRSNDKRRLKNKIADAEKDLEDLKTRK